MSKTVQPPHLDARRSWNDWAETHRATAKHWRWFGMVCLLLAMVAVGVAGWLASLPRVVPYIVEVEGKGHIAGVYAPERITDPNTERNVVRFHLGQFISDLRSVTPDTTLQRKMVKRVYALLPAGQAASQQVSAWYQQNQPFDRSSSEIVAIDIKQILPISGETWRVEWVERSYSRNGELKSSVEMIATLGAMMGGEVSEANLLLNPTGLFITQIDWQRELGQ